MEGMPRDYSWAARVVGRNAYTLREVGIMLGVGRHQARRRLLQSGLPYRLISRHWRHPLDQESLRIAAQAARELSERDPTAQYEVMNQCQC